MISKEVDVIPVRDEGKLPDYIAAELCIELNAIVQQGFPLRGISIERHQQPHHCCKRWLAEVWLSSEGIPC